MTIPEFQQHKRDKKKLIVVTAYDVLIVALAPFDVPAARHLQERIVPYTGWVWLALLMPFKPRSAPPPGQPVEVPGR